ncbi:ribonuclease HI [Helicobacter monodelphidis]|uniref:ribonuclease HI n=1 Tax=Helicobacter sp. 15-1451 TaxID=2004995 RepID=UPI000DCC3549|nr:ribonuclease HI [Helicobacter sp. 15-1451]RAX57618.1 ribonuclease HI [Helicobacter sp. 15-1451]
MKMVSLFCDGSSLGNPGFGGYCAILRYKDKEKCISGSAKNVTNNQMELKAVIEGLNSLKESCSVELFSDSSYVVRGINEWLSNWVKRDFEKVKNKDLWQEYLKVSSMHQIQARWVKGHDGHTENERCDSIARNEAFLAKQSSQNEK